MKQFNLVIVGIGGQGQITLLQVLAEAAFSEGYDVKTSELHGLSQRGGSVEVHLRFGLPPKFGGGIYSPLISQGKADLILGLEMQESLKAVFYADPKTKILVNKYIVPIPLAKNLTETEILKNLKKFSKPRSRTSSLRGMNIFLIPAAEICKEKLGTNIVAGVYLISLASFKNLIPLKPTSILKAIKKIIPEKYLELNIKTFNLAKS